MGMKMPEDGREQAKVLILISLHLASLKRDNMRYHHVEYAGVSSYNHDMGEYEDETLATQSKHNLQWSNVLFIKLTISQDDVYDC